MALPPKISKSPVVNNFFKADGRHAASLLSH